MEVKTHHPALEAADLQIGYPRNRPPLRLSGSIRMQLEPGSLTAIVGPNGVGKSTLLRTLAGLQPALAGAIYWQGQLLEEIPLAQRATCLSIVLTDPPASRNLTVGELVALGRHPHTNWAGRMGEADRAAVREALEQLQLTNLRKRPCHTLSDGQLQRALIARALAQQTPLMLLDEPTTHLDLHHKVNILKALGHIARERRITIAFTTHEIELALQLCDALLILKPETASYGPPAELIASGALQSLFPTDAVRFDTESGTFRVQP
ncbi:ABC transporter ATP-binding protein [Robiginitalea sp. M366]|uniref:ABC transporter ATP-binding protein n=1 Tax=Robiginitalea aestuariiviva TaxID=3036903 RepID=UPI00240D7381|nr:ABC transporter ATP-binding protein [Robiginitalea aestuariiviva]MDG1573489.1 ABC transporter ATP-binding protein [Robiginitalea aestuariiviva]